MNPSLIRIELIGPVLKDHTEVVYILSITEDGTTENYEFKDRDEAVSWAKKMRDGLPK